jgi:hypothetical protein
MGEVLSGIRGLHETIDIRQAQSEQLHDLVRSDLATLRRDHRDLEEKFDCMVCVVQNDVQALRDETGENARALAALVSAVDALRRPLLEIMALKSRMAGLLVGAGMIGSAALWLVEPVYSWFVHAGLTRR